MTAGILSNHRRIAPFGLEGGSPGALGRNWVERADGTREELSGNSKAEMNPGDVFVIETPGEADSAAPADDPRRRTPRTAELRCRTRHTRFRQGWERPILVRFRNEGQIRRVCLPVCPPNAHPPFRD